ncbi:sensor histidine kinase [Pedobacter mendelii]|uniref:histidine kinase n=1 Tax=Pedobacter mendelii TaxID=1908240 RepID=A0ABQ2BG41_9SPHI|nr:GAF domain-containing sensor histidine kinase [Pedobacter mendelii]GGI25416.1 sensor histidine kinase [Pedobacter mendelii]
MEISLSSENQIGNLHIPYSSLNKELPLPKNEPERLASLKAYKIMDTSEEDDFDDLTKMASEICGTPIALITLVDETRQWFKSRIGLDVNQTPREHAFCAHTIIDPTGTMQVTDARSDLRFAENPLVTSDPNIVFYAGVSLQSPDGYSLGSLCVIDRVPKSLTPQQLNGLKILAKQVIAQMELRKKIADLHEANKKLSETNEFMQRFATTAAHDLKNPLSSILMSAELLTRHLEQNGDVKALKLASTNLSSTKKLAKLVNDMLDYSLKPEKLTQNHTSILLSNFLEKTVSMITMPDNVVITYPTENPIITTSEIALQQIFINLLTNAVRYNDKPICKIQISYHKKDGKDVFVIQDNGIGIANKELERIFDRHVTLNHVDRFQQNGTGIGLFTVRFLVEKLNGKISVESEITKGSRFTFSIGS